MEKPSPTAGMYAVIMALYICAWIVALSGLAASQQECKDHQSTFVSLTGWMLAPSVGKHCKNLFRFPWWVLWSSWIPLIADGLAFATPARKLTLGAASALWGFVAVLNVLMANLFYNAVQTNELVATLPVVANNNLNTTMRARLKCTLSGFAIMAGFALLLMCFAPYCTADPDAASGSSTTSKAKGGKIPAEQGTAGQPPQVAVV